MSKFKRRQKKLNKAQARLDKAQKKLDKVSKNTKQFKIRFERSQNKKGKFRTKAKIIREEKTFNGNNRGLIHKAVNMKHRIVGDKPSITKNIDSLEPKTVKGKVFKKSAQAVNFAVHDITQTVVDTALAAENVGLKTADITRREVVNKLKQKYTREAVDDYHRGSFAAARIGVDAVKGTYRHFKQKKQHKVEKAKFKLKKAEFKVFKENTFKPETAKNKSDIRSAKQKFKSQKKAYKSGTKSNIQKAFKIRRKQKFKQTKREIKFDNKRLKSKKKFKKKKLKNQKKINRNSKTGFLVLKPAKYTGKRMTASAWQKSVNADENNDMMHVVDSAKRRIAEPVMQKMSRPERLQRNMNKRDKLKDKNDKKNAKLRKKEKKLNEKHNKPKKKKQNQNRKKRKKSFAEHIREILKNFIKNVYEKEVKRFFACAVVPVLIFLIIFAFIIMIFTSISSSSGFLLGTYAAQDYDLSEAEKYYTKLAWDMNQKVIKVGTKDWKSALKSFGVDTSDYEDEPDSFIWGKSDIFNYSPAYDFDNYKLWSFLCAYYYDFSKKNGDVKYWKFGDDTKKLLQEIFNSEYQFEHFYDNSSNWEQLDSYVYDGKYHHTSNGGYDGSHAYVDFKSVPTILKEFANGKRVYFNIDNGEILNYKKKYKSTGWYFQDQRYIVTDPSGNKINPFYQYDENAYKTAKSGGYGKYHDINYTMNGAPACITIWFPKADYTLKLPDGRDFSDTFCVIVAPDDVAVKKYAPYSTDGLYHIYNYQMAHPGTNFIKDYWDRAKYISICKKLGKDTDGYDGYGYCSFYQKYYWKKDCQLYYNVKQKKNFENALKDKLKSMNHSAERLQYYNLLIGTDSGTMYGNHQTFRNIVNGDSIIPYIKGGKILNGYGYDMQSWNTTHCKINVLHEGIDIQYAQNSRLYAPFECKIKSYDKDKHIIVLRKDDVEYWYDGNGGTKRDTEVTVCNVSLLSTLKKGDKLTEGQWFAMSTGYKNCDELSNPLPYDFVHIKVKIDTDGYGWDFIDPRLVLY